MTTMEKPVTSVQRRTLLAMAMTACLASATSAKAGLDLADLTVVDRETGQPLQIWRRGGRMFVAGAPGSRYGLRITNRSAGRVLVVLSVDGVNVVTGETAGYDQRGYVIGPYQTHDINGWRKSESDIAAFAFAPQSRSYAARTGRPLDVGVIGIAVFRERVAPPPPPPPLAASRAPAQAEDRSTVDEEVVVTGNRNAPAGAPPAMARQERLGTAHGAREYSAATLVNFERASSQPEFVRRIEYDTYDNLVLAGVIPRPGALPWRPRPFPAQGGFVPDPPGGR